MKNPNTPELGPAFSDWLLLKLAPGEFYVWDNEFANLQRTKERRRITFSRDERNARYVIRIKDLTDAEIAVERGSPRPMTREDVDTASRVKEKLILLRQIQRSLDDHRDQRVALQAALAYYPFDIPADIAANALDAYEDRLVQSLKGLGVEMPEETTP